MGFLQNGHACTVNLHMHARQNMCPHCIANSSGWSQQMVHFGLSPPTATALALSRTGSAATVAVVVGGGGAGFKTVFS